MKPKILIAGALAMATALPALAAEGDPVYNNTLIEAEIAEIDEIEVISKIINKADKKTLDIIQDEVNIGTGRFNITANDDGVSVDVNEEVIGVILDEAEIDDEKSDISKIIKKADKKTLEIIQKQLNTQAIRRDGWLDDVDNKR